MNYRVYKGRDIMMLTALHIIIKAFLKFQKILGEVQLNWTIEFGNALLKKIDSTKRRVIGNSTKTDLKSVSDELYALQDDVEDLLSQLKTQIEVNFRKDESLCEIMLQDTGYTEFYSKASKGQQEALIGLLTAFTENIGKYEKHLTEKGINPTIWKRITSFTHLVAETEAIQELTKADAARINGELVDEMNELYLEVIGICKIAVKVFHDQPRIKRYFTYSIVLKSMMAFSSERKIIEELETIDE